MVRDPTFQEDGTREESTGWRDQWISEWHRKALPYDCPCADLDFVVVEYDRLRPAALIEYKTEGAKLEHSTASQTVLERLGDGFSGPGGPLPFFIVRYRRESAEFHISPWNEAAKELCKGIPGNALQSWIPGDRFKKFHLWLRRLRNG